MGHKLSGSSNESSQIIVIRQDDWSVETTYSGMLNSFECSDIGPGDKLVLARNTKGVIKGYGCVVPIIEPIEGAVGLVVGDYSGITMEYIIISTLGNAEYFGDFYNMNRIAGTSNSSNDRGVFGGGYITFNDFMSDIHYVTVSITTDSKDFGDLSVARARFNATSNGTNDRGVFNNGSGGYDILDYVTITSLGNAQSFGTITSSYGAGFTSNLESNRGLSAAYNGMKYITISSLGDAQSFGNMASGRSDTTATSNGTNNRGVVGGNGNLIDYVNISSLGNALDFGDLTAARNNPASTSSNENERGVFFGGSGQNVMDYVTISSVGNATDFGDMSVGRSAPAACSNV